MPQKLLLLFLLPTTLNRPQSNRSGDFWPGGRGGWWCGGGGNDDGGGDGCGIYYHEDDENKNDDNNDSSGSNSAADAIVVLIANSPAGLVTPSASIKKDDMARLSFPSFRRVTSRPFLMVNFFPLKYSRSRSMGRSNNRS